MPPLPRFLLLALALGLAVAPGCVERKAEETAPAGGPVAQAPASAAPTPPAVAPARRRGLWVLCEGSQRVLEHPERLQRLIDDAHALGASDLFVQVYRGGRAWFDSSLADASPFAAARAAQARDPLRALVAAAHAAGLRVHAWVNVLQVADNRHAPILAALGREAVQVDRRGRSLLDYPGLAVPPPDGTWVALGTPALWLDPGAPGVADRVVALLDELVARYPELDGLHLDYLRYPDVLPFLPGSRFALGLDFGYGEATRARFHAETGREAPFGRRTANAAAWDDWRRARVTEILRRTREAARARRPGLELSAAVWFSPERSYLSILQDWPDWLDEGLLDFAVPMLYTTDERLLHTVARGYVGLDARRIWLGLGSWLFDARPSAAATQLRFAEGLPLGGDALFSWDSIAGAPALREALAAEAHGGGS